MPAKRDSSISAARVAILRGMVPPFIAKVWMRNVSGVELCDARQETQENLMIPRSRELTAFPGRANTCWKAAAVPARLRFKSPPLSGGVWRGVRVAEGAALEML
jgi:hypothetical protein